MFVQILLPPYPTVVCGITHSQLRFAWQESAQISAKVTENSTRDKKLISMNEELQQHLKQLSDRIASWPELDGKNLIQLARPSARLATERVPQHLLGLGESRIGGLPDVPPDFEWPRWLPQEERYDQYGQPWKPRQSVPLGFLAQIDLESIPRIDDTLPSTGWLYFFYDRYCEPWGYDPADRGCFSVLYANCDRSSLEPAKPPSDADPKHSMEACRVEARYELSLPNDDEYIDDTYIELLEDLSILSDDVNHRLLGHPQLIQNSMELKCQLVSNGIYCGAMIDYDNAEIKALAEGAKEWQLLFQIDSDAGPECEWGDGGRIYYWIKREDLASLRFENAWLVLQCY